MVPFKNVVFYKYLVWTIFNNKTHCTEQKLINHDYSKGLRVNLTPTLDQCNYVFLECDFEYVPKMNVWVCAKMNQDPVVEKK